MTQRAIVLVGLVRSPETLSRFLTRLQSCADANISVSYATWHGELDKYPALARQLADMGALTYVQQQPDLILPGHMVHQLSSLDLALSELGDDVLVLKTRPDMCDPDDIDRLLERQPVPIGGNPAIPTPFSSLLWAKGAFAGQPFYINDISLIGTARDLRVMTTLPVLTPLRYPCIAPEQMFWAGSIIPRVPVFDAFFRVNPGLAFANPERSSRMHQCFASSTLYARAIACCALFFRDNIRMLNRHPDIPNLRDQIRERSLEDLLWDPKPLSGTIPHAATCTNTVRSAAVWDAMAEGDFAPSLFGDRMKQFLSIYDRPDAIRIMNDEYPQLQTEAGELAAAIQLSVDRSPLKQVQFRGHERFVATRAANWKIAQTGTTLTAALEQEVNMLRRQLQALQTDLAKLQSELSGLRERSGAEGTD